MSNRFPRWVLWTGLSLGVWLLWALLLHGKMSWQVGELRSQSEASRQTLETLEARVAAVPNLVARIDSTQTRLHSDFEGYTCADDLDGLMAGLLTAARRHGITSADAAPDLQSILSLDHPPKIASTNEIRCDTLLVELSALGSFRQIGRWLDTIEQRPDFRHWIECRWSIAGDNNLAQFNGRVGLLIASKLPKVVGIEGAGSGS